MMDLSFVVTEEPDSWRVTRDPVGPEWPASFPTGAQALAGIRSHLARLAESGISSVARIEWRPATAVGRRVASALAT